MVSMACRRFREIDQSSTARRKTPAHSPATQPRLPVIVSMWLDPALLKSLHEELVGAVLRWAQGPPQ